MSAFQPRRLILAAGLATAILGCSSQPKTQSQPASAAATAPTTPAAPNATPAAPPAQTPAAVADNIRRGMEQDANAARRGGGGGDGGGGGAEGPGGANRYNGTPAEDAGKPGTYIVLKGKPDKVPNVKLGDKTTVARIIDEGKNRNQVMDHLTHITTKIGPRLTGSANVETANKWAMEQFQSWGLESSLYEWGTIPVRFDRGPSTARIGTLNDDGEFRSSRDLEFTTSAWAAGTSGPVCGRIVKMPETEEQYEAVKGNLKGAWVLTKAAAPGRRGVGGSGGARQRMFAETRKKMESGELKLVDGKVVVDASAAKAEPPKADPAPEAKAAPTGIAGAWEGIATGGRIPEGGAPFTLDLKAEGATVTGTMAYTNYHSAGIKDGKYDEATKTLTFAWEGPGGVATYTFKLDDQSVKGESKRDDGAAITLNAKRTKAAEPAKLAEAPKSDESEPKGPTLEQKVFMHGPAGYIASAGAEIVRTGGSYRNLSADNLPKDCEVTVRGSDYDYINSRVADGNTIYAEINCDNRFTPGPIKCYNTVAEIRGAELPNEVVIVSAHLDSWNGPGSQGTTDNGTGSSVTLEAARILAKVGAKPKRTIRFVLWTGEEQGLLGSRAYVEDLKKNDQLKNISAVFVDDGGTNFEGGLNCFNSQADILGAATAPINGVFWSSTDKRFLDVNIKPVGGGRLGRVAGGGGSDHQSFISAGVPGFFWDEVGRADYPYGWHTQNDKLALAIPEYLIQSSTCAAVTAYNVACAPTLLPREPLPEEKKEQTSSAGEWRQFGTDDPAVPVRVGR